MDKIFRYRIIILLVIFFLAFLVAGGRLFELQILHYNFYRDKVEDQRQRIIVLASPRGNIFDRNGGIFQYVVQYVVDSKAGRN